MACRITQFQCTRICGQGISCRPIHTKGVRTNAPVEILDKALDEPQETRRTCRKARLDDCNLNRRVFNTHLANSRIQGNSQLPSAAALARA